MDKYMRPERFDIEPTSTQADKQWIHWKTTFGNFLTHITNATEEDPQVLKENSVNVKMSVPVITPHAFFGLKPGIKGTATYVTDHEILYPVGGLLTLHNFPQKYQRFIKLPTRQKEINIICVSPDKKIVALAERAESKKEASTDNVGKKAAPAAISEDDKVDKPSISFYSLTTLRRTQIFTVSDTSATEFVSLCFTLDGKYIVAILGEPEWKMLHYSLEKSKVESFTKANTSTNPGPVTQVACNPNDSSVVCIVGAGLFRMLAYSETVWRQYGFQKADIFPVNTVCWLSFDQVLAGTLDGRLLVVDGGELRGVFKALQVQVVTPQAKDEPIPILMTNQYHQDLDINMEVREMMVFNKGFAYACGAGEVHVFEKENKTKYVKKYLLVIPKPEFKMDDDFNLIQSLSINVTQNTILATTLRCQLYSATLWTTESAEVQHIQFTIVGEPLHHGPVTGLSTCAWKPIIMTCSEMDHTIRVWNYQTESLELIKQYQEDIYSIALHPTGLFTAIGFSDKLRFMLLLIEDIQPIREFSIRSCLLCAFSINGHFFAAVDGTSINVYSSVNFQNIHTLTGHSGKIQNMVWTDMDSKLVSCGSEGAVYEWDISTGDRVGEIFTKNCVYNDVAATSDGKVCYAVGKDGFIREISNSAIIRSIMVNHQQLQCIAFARSDLMLFVATTTGNVVGVKFPMIEPLEIVENIVHDSSITQMSLTYDDLMLITCSVDGSVCLWKLSDTEGKTVRMDRDFAYSEEILINKEELRDKLTMIRDLNLRLHELETEHAYQMRQTEAIHKEKIKELQEKYSDAIELLKDRNEQLESMHKQDVQTLKNDIVTLEKEHEDNIRNLESNCNEKLIVEYEKYKLLQEKCHYMKVDYEKQLKDLENEKETVVKELTETYETQLSQKIRLIDELHENAKEQMKQHETIKQQIEEDADREIIELKASYEKELREEREAHNRLRGEAGVTEKKLVSSQKQAEDYQHQAHILRVEQQKFQQAILALERDILGLKKEINERDTTIQEKEKYIYDLKKKSQELDKFKFVLNFKITELKNQIEPKDEEIKEKKEQIQDMEVELENLQKLNTNLELQLVELKEKLAATDSELEREKHKNRENNSLLRRIRVDLHNCSSHIQNPNKLKECVKNLYHKYSHDEEAATTRVQDVDAQMEFMRQREHLERTVEALRKQVYKSQKGQYGDNVKIMEENTTLIQEINALRRELKLARARVSDLESILGVTGKLTSAKEAQLRLQMALKKHDEIHAHYRTKIEEIEKTNQVLKEEIRRLVRKLSPEEQKAYKHHLQS